MSATDVLQLVSGWMPSRVHGHCAHVTPKNCSVKLLLLLGCKRTGLLTQGVWFPTSCSVLANHGHAMCVSKRWYAAYHPVLTHIVRVCMAMMRQDAAGMLARRWTETLLATET